MAVVVLTGCSSGFGYEGALSFARAGHSVFATMRDLSRGDALREAAESESLDIRLKRLDVAESETFTALFDEISASAGSVDVLVNNAGINRSGALEDLSESAIRDVIETNCIGPLLLARTVLPHMRRQGSGLIIMMSSLSGIAGLPGDVAYTASKFAIEGATEALRHEVDRWGIRVALVEGGLYATRIFDAILPGESPLPADYPTDSAYRALIERRLGEIRERLPDAMDPKIVGDLFVKIAESDGSQLRWPADELAERVLATMLAQDDVTRDRFLRDVAGCDWWSNGEKP